MKIIVRTNTQEATKQLERNKANHKAKSNSQELATRKNRMLSNNNTVSKKIIKKKPPPVRYQPYINPQPMPDKEELANIADLWENNKGGIDDFLAKKFDTLKM